MKTATTLNKKSIIAWCFYDWAVSPFPTLITTFIFAAYFTQKVAINEIIGTRQWGDANALAGLIIAFLSPILGAIADHEGRRKPWLLALIPIMFVAATGLWFVKPSVDYVNLALCLVIFGTIALEVSMVFYNAMLSELAPPRFIGRLSGWGWGFGYIGGLAALVIALQLALSGDLSQIRLTGPLVGLWLIIFAWPLFALVKDRPSTGLGFAKASRKGISSLWCLLRRLHKEYRSILIFLIARMFYVDGLITVFAFGGIYAAGVFHMSMNEVIEFGIGMNVAAGIGAAIFGWLDDARGSKPTILLTLFIMILCGMGILLAQTKLWFWILGMGFSLGVGPVQAASRSLLIRISPPELITELFGLFAFSGKATSFIGPWALGTVTALYGSQRIGMSTAFVFMVLGAVLLCFVRGQVSSTNNHQLS